MEEKKKKRTSLSKLGSALIKGSKESIIDYCIHDILIPTAQDTFQDIIQGSIDILLKGNSSNNRQSSRYRNNYGNHINYASRNNTYANSARHYTNTNRNSEEVIFKTRNEANQVLSDMIELVDTYNVCTVSDYKELCGLPMNPVDESYGWESLRSAKTQVVRGGFTVKLPKSRPVD